MSRIRGVELKVQKEVMQTRNKNNRKDTVEDWQIAELLENLPKLGEIFDVHRKIGEGTFSSVYLASLKGHNRVPEDQRRWFAVKHLVPTVHPARIEHELRCLQDMGGKNNVIGVDLCLRHLDTVVFVMPYIPHKKFSEFVVDMDARELAAYIRALMTALKHVHSFGVIHRDVKPSNFLYDRENRRYLLVDFGLAQRICPPPPPAHATLKRPRPSDDLTAESAPDAKRMALDLRTADKTSVNASETNTSQSTKNGDASASDAGACAGACVCAGVRGVCGVCARRPQPRAPRAGTQGFRPPEVLLKVRAQSAAVDVWAAGVVLCAALSARSHFLRARDDTAALAELVDLLGADTMRRAAASLGRNLLVSGSQRGLCLRKLCAWLRGAAPPAPPAPPATPATPAPPAPPAPPCQHCHPHISRCLCRDHTVSPKDIRPGVTIAGFPDAAFSLAAQLLEPDPNLRLSAAAALQHPFLTDW